MRVRIKELAAVFLLLVISCFNSNDADRFALQQMEENGKVDGIIMNRCLKTGKPLIKLLAARTCGVVRDTAFISELGILCNHRDLKIRRAALFSLGEIR